jgi:hypothetical protein
MTAHSISPYSKYPVANFGSVRVIIPIIIIIIVLSEMREIPTP